MRKLLVAFAVLLLVVASGCAMHSHREGVPGDVAVSASMSPAIVADSLGKPVGDSVAAQPEYEQHANDGRPNGSMPPRTIAEQPEAFRDITLAEVIQLALQNGKVIRDVGGRVLAGPEATATAHDVAIEYTDPNFGVQAALSAFDANLASQFNYANNDRVFNNITLGGGAQELRQDLATLQTDLSRVAAYGTRMNLRSTIGHDRNNRAGNLFGHLWESQWEAELRQPLLQGAGHAFNQIAGPNARPGMRFTNGVVIAQMNNDISKLDFELAVRGFVSEIEDSYWRLQQAYHEYESRQATWRASERIWNSVRAKMERGLAGGEADKEAQARAQYYYYRDLGLEALNGSATTPGIYESERRLRWLMGLTANDGELLRPVSAVSDARVVYDWDTLSHRAVTRRAEVRRQMQRVKQEELRLVIARSFLLPRLDARALYRLRGFGDDLAGNDGTRFSSAARDIAEFDHQEWEFGLQLNVPIGRRQAYAGMRHSELRLARERSILHEQQLLISHELANAIARTSQLHASMQLGRERMNAARDRLEATEAAFEADKLPVDLLLDAQERLGAAETRYFQTVASYAIAEKNVRQASGELLTQNGITLESGCELVCAASPGIERDTIDYHSAILETHEPRSQESTDSAEVAMEVTEDAGDSQSVAEVEFELRQPGIEPEATAEGITRLPGI